MATRRPFDRPMAGWWKRNPFFLRYMAREGTAVFVVLYALLLLAGVLCLALGREAYEAWLAFLRGRWMLPLHAVFLAVFGYHTWSWFRIMPRTLAPIVVAGRRLPDAVITATGLAASLAASLALYGVLLWLAR